MISLDHCCVVLSAALYTVHCTLSTVTYVLYTVPYELYHVQCNMYSPIVKQYSCIKCLEIHLDKENNSKLQPIFTESAHWADSV